VDTLGLATAGSPFVMLTITSPENHARLAELQDIQLRLADPRRVADDAELQRLFDEGKTVVLITQGIHATEVGASQMSADLAYELAASDDPRILEILDNVIVLQIPSLNPDGLQWVADWYNTHVGTDFEASPLPWLYHFYTGHDNNRDWYAFTQRETILTVEHAHNAWHPQIVHDVHQMGSYGARIFVPPYIEP
jgi:murein tripeptide amidase MpaA